MIEASLVSEVFFACCMMYCAHFENDIRSVGLSINSDLLMSDRILKEKI